MFFVLFMSYILPHPGEVWGEGWYRAWLQCCQHDRSMYSWNPTSLHTPSLSQNSGMKNIQLLKYMWPRSYMNLGDCYLIPAFLNLSFKWSSLLRTSRLTICTFCVSIAMQYQFPSKWAASTRCSNMVWSPLWSWGSAQVIKCLTLV
jgi:hypothetical protein